MAAKPKRVPKKGKGPRREVKTRPQVRARPRSRPSLPKLSRKIFRRARRSRRWRRWRQRYVLRAAPASDGAPACFGASAAACAGSASACMRPATRWRDCTRSQPSSPSSCASQPKSAKSATDGVGPASQPLSASAASTMSSNSPSRANSAAAGGAPSARLPYLRADVESKHRRNQRHPRAVDEPRRIRRAKSRRRSPRVRRDHPADGLDGAREPFVEPLLEEQRARAQRGIARKHRSRGITLVEIRRRSASSRRRRVPSSSATIGISTCRDRRTHLAAIERVHHPFCRRARLCTRGPRGPSQRTARRCS